MRVGIVNDVRVAERTQVLGVVRGLTLHDDQTRAFHRTQVVPGGVALARRLPDVVGVHEEGCRVAVALQQGEGVLVDAAPVVVEGQYERLSGKRRTALEVCPERLEGYDRKTAAANRFELFVERVASRVEPNLFAR